MDGPLLRHLGRPCEGLHRERPASPCPRDLRFHEPHALTLREPHELHGHARFPPRRTGACTREAQTPGYVALHRTGRIPRCATQPEEREEAPRPSASMCSREEPPRMARTGRDTSSAHPLQGEAADHVSLRPEEAGGHTPCSNSPLCAAELRAEHAPQPQERQHKIAAHHRRFRRPSQNEFRTSRKRQGSPRRIPQAPPPPSPPSRRGRPRGDARPHRRRDSGRDRPPCA